MEYTIVQSDLVDSEIKPQDMRVKFNRLLATDIRRSLTPDKLHEVGDPVTGEWDVVRSFTKMGMTYCESRKYRNLYISPRPDQETLTEFFRKSEAYAFWLKELWPATDIVRRQKIIRPQLAWAKMFIRQYLEEELLDVAAFYPNQLGYLQEIHDSGMTWNYHLIEPLYDLRFLPQPYGQDMIRKTVEPETYDCIFLFEALDRSADPAEVLRQVEMSLRPGGLCFLTCLLSSGFEVQILGEQSAGILPPERMNLFSYEGLIALIAQCPQLSILEFSTPGVLDISNILIEMKASRLQVPAFLTYLAEQRNDPNLFLSFQEFLQMNKLSAFGRLVLRKQRT